MNIPPCRRRVIQIFGHGLRVLDGSYMTQELNFALSSDATVVSAYIADPYVLLTMSDASIQLLIGGIQF